MIGGVSSPAPCDLPRFISSFFLSFREFCAPSPRLNHSRFTSSSERPQWTDPRSSPCFPSLVGFRALPHHPGLSTSLPNHRRLSSSSKPKTLGCSSRIAPYLRIGCHETLCPGHSPRHLIVTACTVPLLAGLCVSSMYTTMIRLSSGYSSLLSGHCVLSIYPLSLTIQPTLSKVLALHSLFLSSLSIHHLHGPHSAFCALPHIHPAICNLFFEPRSHLYFLALLNVAVYQTYSR